MSASAEARLSALDRILDNEAASTAMADELFSVVDTLAAQPSLRRALTDPSTPDQARTSLVSALFGGKVSQAVVRVLTEATQLRWSTSGALSGALERQAVRVLLRVAQDAGQLDGVEDELFKVGRLVAGNRDLSATISDRRSPVEGRQELLRGLIESKVLPITAALANRAVVARARTFDLTLEDYLRQASALRNRAVATVVTAVELSDDQKRRLQGALSRQVGRDVNLRVVLDPSVLGGVRVTLGDEVIEGTVAGRLNDAQRKLS